jgi:methyl-accepting chemotaxis protein
MISSITPADAVGYVDLAFKLLEIISIVGGIALGLREMGKASAKTDSSLKQQNDTLERQSKAMSGMQEDIKALNKIVTEVALQNQRVDMMAKQMDRLEHRIDELRHGDGWIKGPKGIDKEY